MIDDTDENLPVSCPVCNGDIDENTHGHLVLCGPNGQHVLHFCGMCGKTITALIKDYAEQPRQ